MVWIWIRPCLSLHTSSACAWLLSSLPSEYYSVQAQFTFYQALHQTLRQYVDSSRCFPLSLPATAGIASFFRLGSCSTGYLRHFYMACPGTTLKIRHFQAKLNDYDGWRIGVPKHERRVLPLSPSSEPAGETPSASLNLLHYPEINHPDARRSISLLRHPPCTPSQMKAACVGRLNNLCVEVQLRARDWTTGDLSFF